MVLPTPPWLKLLTHAFDPWDDDDDGDEGVQQEAWVLERHMVVVERFVEGRRGVLEG